MIPGLRFTVTTDDGQVLVDRLIVKGDDVDGLANAHGDLALQALEHGQPVTLVVRDPDLDDAVVHTYRVEPHRPA